MLDAVTRARWKAIEPLLDRALEVGPTAWSDYLDLACQGDAELRAAVERLLVLYPRLGEPLTRPTPTSLDALFRDQAVTDLVSGTRIGPYRIVGEAGRGGMGVVYLAERDDDQYRRRVALKLLGRGVADPQLVRRFLDERQILASLDHPNIAKLLDGGVTTDGLPWFALEYIEGEPIDRYCDRLGLTIDRRLGLFLDVCEAVQYAHRNLVIHRDLKPSNILITADGSVKLLDFGIAKLLDPTRDSEATLTAVGARALTPEYASPEQVRGDPVAVTTDVYSLGVLLYQLLTGRRPYKGAGRLPHEVERAVLEDEPEPPSAAVSGGDDGTARARGTTPERLRRRLRGDLDMIVLMALRKEAARRYVTVDRLAADVSAHLAGQPVSAQPDRWSYRAGKFARRHVASLTAAAAAMVLLVVVGVVIATQYARARLEQARAERVSAFVTDLLRSPDPLRGRGGSVTVREVLDSAVKRIDNELKQEPAVRADLLGVIGRSYDGLGMYDTAARVLRTAVALRQRVHDTGHALAEDEAALAVDLHASGHDTTAGDSVARLAIRTARKQLRPDDPALARILTLTAPVMDENGHPALAESLFGEAILILRRQPRVDRLALSDALRSLGAHYWARKEMAAAETLYAEALALRRDTLPPGHPDIGDLDARLGDVLAWEGKPEAERYLREGIAVKQRTLGANHPSALENLFDLARLLAKRGDYAAAESLLSLEVKGSSQAGPDGERIKAEALGGLAHIALLRGDTARALAGFEEELRQYQRITPPNEMFYYGGLLADIGDIYSAQRRFNEAEPLILKALTAARQQFGDTNTITRSFAKKLADMYDRWGKLEQAREYRRLAGPTPSSP